MKLLEIQMEFDYWWNCRVESKNMDLILHKCPSRDVPSIISAALKLKFCGQLWGEDMKNLPNGRRWLCGHRRYFEWEVLGEEQKNLPGGWCCRYGWGRVKGVHWEETWRFTSGTMLLLPVWKVKILEKRITYLEDDVAVAGEKESLGIEVQEMWGTYFKNDVDIAVMEET